MKQTSTDSKFPLTNSLIILYLLASVFSALSSYRIHIEGIEQAALPILEAILQFEGRAPDQYRIIPYILIDILSNLERQLFGEQVSLKYPIIFFDAFFLFLSALVIQLKFRIDNIRIIVFGLFLIYPFSMFDGYRPISSFILFMATLTVLQIFATGNKKRRVILLLFIAILSFSRADIALMIAAIAAVRSDSSTTEKVLVLSIPIVSQALLSFVLFPQAAYFSPVFMVLDNLTFRFIIYSPLTYLAIGLVIYFRTELAAFFSFLIQEHRKEFAVLAGYVLALMLVARPNEYRLFLPLIPLILALIQQQQMQRAVVHTAGGASG